MPAPRITKKLENASDTNIVFLNGKLIVNGQSFRKTLGTYRHRVKEIKEHIYNRKSEIGPSKRPEIFKNQSGNTDK